MPIVQINPVINHDSSKWCALKYPGHKHGCPNLAKGCQRNITYFDNYYDLSKPVYAVYTTFDLGAHVEKMRKKHPNWSMRQLRNLLYWQGTARKNFRLIVKKFLEDYPDYDICSPEGMGVDVTATMATVGIKLDWPPTKLTYLIVFAGIKNPKCKKGRTVVLI